MVWNVLVVIGLCSSSVIEDGTIVYRSAGSCSSEFIERCVQILSVYLRASFIRFAIGFVPLREAQKCSHGRG